MRENKCIKRTLLLAITVASILLTSSFEVSSARPSCSHTATALSAAVQRLIDSDNAQNLEGLLAGYTDDAILLPPKGENVVGKSAIKSHYERLFSGSTIDLSIKVLEARADGNLGFVRGLTKGAVTSQPGATRKVVNDKFLGLVRCEAGQWRVSHLMWNPEIPTN